MTTLTFNNKSIFSLIFIFVIGTSLISAQNWCGSVAHQKDLIKNLPEKATVLKERIDSFNDAYLANDMTGQLELFTEDAVATVNSQEMSPSEMITAFMGGREFYNDIKNSDRATGTFNFESGDVYTCTWFDWEGTSKSSGVVVGNPVHAWFKWEGDKVTEVTYIFDSAQYVANMGSDE